MLSEVTTTTSKYSYDRFVLCYKFVTQVYDFIDEIAKDRSLSLVIPHTMAHLPTSSCIVRAQCKCYRQSVPGVVLQIMSMFRMFRFWRSLVVHELYIVVLLGMS